MYTREEVLGMVTGRELDAMVAEHVMGWHTFSPIDPECDFSVGVGGHRRNYAVDPFDEKYKVFPLYSTDITAAWEVVEKLREDWLVNIADCGPWGWRIDILSDSENKSDVRCPIQKSIPEAICKAALLSLLKED